MCCVSIGAFFGPFFLNKNLFTNSMYEFFFSLLSSSFCFEVGLFLFLVSCVYVMFTLCFAVITVLIHCRIVPNLICVLRFCCMYMYM